MKPTRDKRFTTFAAAAGLLVWAMLPTAAEAQVSSEAVKEAVRKGIAHIRHRQEGDGSWPRHGGHQGGVTALSLLAMLHAGVPPADPDVARGLAALSKIRNERTYVVSLKAQVFAAAYDAAEDDDPNRGGYLEALRAAAAWLAEAQLDNGMWTYTNPKKRSGRGDNSNTQFALLGLHEAANLTVRPDDAPIQVPTPVWDRSRAHFENTQSTDGGWGYRGRTRGYGSMTAAGVASLYICGLRLHVSGQRQFINGEYPNCGKYTQNLVLAKGLEWLAKEFSVRENPGKGGRWHHYWLYGLERVGMISGKRNLGLHDWYREGAAFLTATQQPDGAWPGDATQTPFAALFLAKGNRPVLIQKVQWQGHWNRNIHDLENLCSFIGDKLGKQVTWQTTALNLPVEELRTSPILLITGHEFPNFTDEQKETLRRYVRAGGTLLFEACCGKDAFEEGFREFAADVWPEYRVRRLEAGEQPHPVWNSYFRYEADFKPMAAETGGDYGLSGIDVGCRTSVFFSPRALSCLWELQDIPKWSEFAYKLGTNIAAYATGREQLANKLDAVELPADVADAGERKAEIPRGAVRIARLFHEGECTADPHAMVNLASMLRDKANVDVVARERYIHLEKAEDARSIFEYPVVFMNGHHSFSLSEAEIERLRLYLKRGGVLVASNCCGRKAFDASFREMIGKLFPEGTKDVAGRKIALTELPEDHPVFTGKVGVPLGEVRYRNILAEELRRDGAANWRGTKHPPVEAVVIDGRTAVLYSKYDFCCALEGDRPYGCRGYVDEDGKRLALNLFLFAISY